MNNRYKYIILKDGDEESMDLIEGALEAGYHPMRETSMYSSAGGSNSQGRDHAPTILCILVKRESPERTTSVEDTRTPPAPTKPLLDERTRVHPDPLLGVATDSDKSGEPE